MSGVKVGVNIYAIIIIKQLRTGEVIMQGKFKCLMASARSASCLMLGAANAADKPEVIPGWQVAVPDGKDTPLHDPMILYSSGGVDGKMAIIGIPSFKTYRHVDCGVDTHEISFGGSNKGNKNGTPDGI